MGWFPFFRQKKEYTCGPASLEMVMRFFGKNFTEENLAKLAHTKKDGTLHAGIIQAARKAGFYCYVHRNSSINHIQHFIDKGDPVIVNYIDPNSGEGHYGVIIGYSSKNLVMNDSSNGQEFSIHKSKFEDLWHGGNNKKTNQRWILVLSKNPFFMGKQYYPM